MILTGGVDISDKEIEYVNDALKTGWDAKHDSYIRHFEEAFAQYVGVRYAISLAGGTQALTLALATLGIGKGDEVIMPDLTYFACSNVVKLLRAKPVFMDVDNTFCINPDSFKEAINDKTKAVMPVWLYGNAPEMDEIMRIAEVHNLWVVEDACPAVGTFYNDRHAGSFGDFGCFSFHGAKIMTTGFGGMLVTNNKHLYEKALWLADHGEDKKRPDRFWQTGVGYSFPMPNINAAMGLAQLERIDEFVNKKRKIWSWYNKRINVFNGELHNARVNRWLTCYLSDNREQLMARLKAKDIDTRPFFYPISSFPMYGPVNNPIAYDFGYKGLNLPSGVQRTEKEIDYICKIINEN